MRTAILLGLLALTACGSSSDDKIPGYEGLKHQIENNRVGMDADRWIEMKNVAGEWEKTGLIFGYADDNDECLKAIAGLKKVNYAREYRCEVAN